MEAPPFELHYAKTVRLVYAIVRDGAQAEDIVQEAFLQAHRSLRNIRSGEPFGPWFLKLAIRLARRMRARSWRELSVSLQDWFTWNREPEDVAAAEFPQALDLRERLWEALRHLRPELREAVVLRYLGDQSEEEVARTTGVPLGTVKSRIYRARQQLARLLQDEPAARPAVGGARVSPSDK